MILAELHPSNNKISEKVTINARLHGTNEKGKPEEYAVSASTQSRSKREILLEGMTVLQNRIIACDKAASEAIPILINGKEISPASLSRDTCRCWVDPLISQWLGGYRDGLIICWNIDGALYKYDIFAHRLTRVVNAER